MSKKPLVRTLELVCYVCRYGMDVPVGGRRVYSMFYMCTRCNEIGYATEAMCGSSSVLSTGRTPRAALDAADLQARIDPPHKWSDDAPF